MTSQQSNDRRCHFAKHFGADETVQSPDVDAMNLKVMKTVDDLHLRPPQPIPLGHHQFVFGFQHRQARLQLMAVLLGRSTTDYLIEAVGAPRLLQR